MSSSLRRAAKKAGGGITVVLALLVGLIAFAPSAFAHHSNVNASEACQTDGDGYLLTWTASTWEGGAGETRHPAILVEYSVNGGSSWTTVPNDSSAAPFTNAALTSSVNGVGIFTGPGSSFTGTIEIPNTGSTQNFVVRARPLGSVPAGTTWFWLDDFILPADGGTAADTKGPGASLTWGNGNTSTEGRQDSLTLDKNDCKPPAAPGGSAQVLCPSGAIRFSLTNTGGQAIELDVFVDGVNRGNNINVPAGTTAASPVNVDVAAATVGLDENETLPWQVKKQDGTVLASGNVTRNCVPNASPAAAAAVVCVTGQPFIRVTLENLTAAGGESVTFQTSSAGTPAFTTRNDTINAGGADVVIDIPVNENAARTVIVSALGLAGSPKMFTLTGDCQAAPDPEATVVGVCNTQTGGGTVTVTLWNPNGPGGESVLLFIDASNNTLDEAVTVPGNTTSGAPIVRTYQVAEGASLSVVVKLTNAAGAVIVSQTGDSLFDCIHADPALGATTECAVSDAATPGIVINLVNNGFEAGTVVVGGANVVVPAKVGSTPGTASKFIAVAEGGTYNIAVTFDGDPLTGSSVTGTRDCQKPAFGAVTECATNQAGVPGVTVTLTNPGSESVTVNIDHGVGDVAVPAGTPGVVVFVAQAENADGFTLTATSAGNPDQTVQIPKRDCQDVSLELESECATDESGATGVLVTATNTGEEAATITLGEDTFDLPHTFFVPQDEGAAGFTLNVASSDGQKSLEIPERDCTDLQAEAAVVCADGEIHVTLTNAEGAEDVEVTISLDGEEFDTVTVPAGASGDSAVVVAIPVDENTTHDVLVEAGDFFREAFDDLVVDCFDAGADIDFECAEDGEQGIVVTLTNVDGEEDLEFTITVDGDEFETVTVPAGAGGEGEDAVVLTIPVDENGEYEVVVTAEDDDFEESETVNVDCVHPAADATFTCVSGDIVVSLTNPTAEQQSGSPATFVVTITKQGGSTTASAPIVVQPNGTGSYTFEAEENSTYDVVVTEATEENAVLTRSFVVNCNIDGLSLTSGGICDGDVPHISWAITLDSPLPAKGVTVEFLDASGVVRQTVTGQGLTGRLLWPGAVVNAAGDPVDWPGWLFVNGQWVRGDDGFLWARPTMQVRFQINPTLGPVTATYPDPSPTCVTDPPVQVAGVQVTRPAPAPAPLPRTGTDSTPWLVLAGALLMISGTGLFGTARLLGLRRRR